MPDPMVEGRAGRLQENLRKAVKIAAVYEEWLSGRVVDIAGPFADGTENAAREFAEKLYVWAKETEDA